MSDFDSPWKEALDRYFTAFLRFFFPNIHADIDWSRKYEMLDTELQQVVRTAELGHRHFGPTNRSYEYGQRTTYGTATR